MPAPDAVRTKIIWRAQGLTNSVPVRFDTIFGDDGLKPKPTYISVNTNWTCYMFKE